nr:uncharacterized protein LOC124806962 [Hydra vulgaris]
MNCFIYNDNNKVRNIYDSIFEAGAFPLINRPTRVTKYSATLLDNIITTDIFNNDIKKGIIKTDISDHFPIFLTIPTNQANVKKPNKILTKRILYNPQIIANEFNKYFVEIGPTLSDKIPITKTSFYDFLAPLDKGICSDELSSELSFEEFEKAFKTFKKNKATGPDEINGNIIIDCYEQIKNILFKIYKASIQQGIFPERLKIAKIIPIHKEGDRSNINNYRPISILSVFSKILDRIMFNRVNNYFNYNNLLYNNQVGFKKDQLSMPLFNLYATSPNPLKKLNIH